MRVGRLPPLPEPLPRDVLRPPRAHHDPDRAGGGRLRPGAHQEDEQRRRGVGTIKGRDVEVAPELRGRQRAGQEAARGGEGQQEAQGRGEVEIMLFE